MISLSFNDSDAKVVAKLRERAPLIVSAVMRKMDELMLRLQAKIVGEKLSGQVLKRRTGKLSNSIRAIPAVIEANFQGDSIRGAVEGGGGPAWYGRIHEFGGVFNVKARIATHLFGRPLKTPHQIKAHTADFPERSFMRTSLEEMRGDIFASLTQTVKEELKK